MFKKAVLIHLLIIHCFISLQFSKYKCLYHFIITRVIFRHLFSVEIGNELLRVCYNFNYHIQSMKLISKFLGSEMQSVFEFMCLMLQQFHDLFCQQILRKMRNYSYKRHRLMNLHFKCSSNPVDVIKMCIQKKLYFESITIAIEVYTSAVRF